MDVKWIFSSSALGSLYENTSKMVESYNETMLFPSFLFVINFQVERDRPMCVIMQNNALERGADKRASRFLYRPEH